jgi:membrane associated rhomboid family serine protease
MKTAYQQYRNATSAVTYALMTVVAAVFLVEVLLTAVLGVQSIRVFATELFGVHPRVAWTFSPILYRGILHFAATLAGLTIVGIPIEKHWRRRRYVVFLTLTAYEVVVRW